MKVSRSFLNLRLLIGSLLVAFVAVGLGVFLYYGRVKGLSSIFNSDLFVFGVPAVGGFDGFFYVARKSRRPDDPFRQKLIASLVFAICALFMSTWITGLIALNTWGS